MRFIAIICLCFALKGKAQYYVMAAPNVAFNTPLNDTKNLLGGTIEVGKYFGKTAVGINYQRPHIPDLFAPSPPN